MRAFASTIFLDRAQGGVLQHLWYGSGLLGANFRASIMFNFRSLNCLCLVAFPNAHTNTLVIGSAARVFLFFSSFSFFLSTPSLIERTK